MYERNDQVLYQLSRAYEEIGQVDEAMGVMNRLVGQYPNSRYLDEVQFRRGEYFFTRKKYLDAEEAYTAVLKFGVGSVYYERALFKKGWTFYKQELYEEALHEFIAMLDYKVSVGYDFEQTTDKIEKKRIDDTFRVISLAFSNLGGATSVQEYFTNHGSRAYEDGVYSHLAEFYFSKRRYSDAANTYNTFVENNPFHKKSPHFSMRVIAIYLKGGFPRLVIEAKKQYASTYGINAEYWNYFEQSEYPEVLGYLKTNLIDLANHYHSLYQNKKFVKEKPNNYAEASHWYRQFLQSFPKDEQSPAINYQLADLLLENKDFNQAAIEYQRTAYDYPVNDKSQKAAYAAVYAYREHLKVTPQIQQYTVKRDIIRSSIKLVDTFPQHEKATVVLGAAVDDLFSLDDFELAIETGRRLIKEYPKAEPSILRGSWLVVAHSSFEIENFSDAELAYIEVLNLTAKDDASREKLVDNLAASIYKQGELAKAAEEYKTAVKHFLRIADLAPTSKIRPSAEYDAAAVLIQIRDLEQAETVLLSFRSNYPQHELQHDVTKKIAFVYKELGKYTLAAKEFERVAAESKEEPLIREAMLTAAELYEKAKDTDNSLRVYEQFVAMFPKPLEFALETHYKIAMIYKSRDDLSNYRKSLQHIITTDAAAGEERTDRTRYLAAQASLVIIEPRFDDFIAIKLVKPLEVSVKKKQNSMKALVASYSKLVDYQVADVTAASTYYIAEIYYNFSRSLMESERPEGLTALELEEFVLALEDQAFPFEEKTISVHEKNVELLTIGVYSPWIDRSIEKLAKLLPARYAKPEQSTGYIAAINTYRYSNPRFVRDDAATLYIEKIGFFRYESQNRKKYAQDGFMDAVISNVGVVTGAATGLAKGLGNVVNKAVDTVVEQLPELPSLEGFAEQAPNDEAVEAAPLISPQPALQDSPESAANTKETSSVQEVNTQAGVEPQTEEGSGEALTAPQASEAQGMDSNTNADQQGVDAVEVSAPEVSAVENTEAAAETPEPEVAPQGAQVEVDVNTQKDEENKQPQADAPKDEGESQKLSGKDANSTGNLEIESDVTTTNTDVVDKTVPASETENKEASAEDSRVTQTTQLQQ